MSKVQSIKTTDIVLDKSIYPRSNIDHKRVATFEENMRDGFEFDPIHLQEHPDEPGKYRILDGAHRFTAYKGIGEKEIPAQIIKLNGTHPLLYAAKQAIGPRQLNDEEARDAVRRAYLDDPKLSSVEIGKAFARARRTVDLYIADLKAAAQMDLDLKLFRMQCLGIPQERISARMDIPQKTVFNHLAKLATLPKWLNSELEKGFTVTQIAEKHGWPEPMVWSLKLKEEDDMAKYHELQWGIRTWDDWKWTDCDKRFGDEWPGRIPAQLIAHILYYFSKPGDLVIDPMAGGGVVADTCLAFNRRCWSFDMVDRTDERPEIEHHYWDINNLKWPVNGKTKPDLIIFDPPYFSKKAKEYGEESISNLSKVDYLKFLERFFKLAGENSKKETRLAMINADWRDFQNTPAMEEKRKNSILINDYLNAMAKSGWEEIHIMWAPMSSERFHAGVVAAMQKRKILGVTNRYVIVAEKK